MRLRHLRSSAGFTYLAVLFLIVVMGIMMGAVGESMYMVMKRDREEELLFRGEQYRAAIERWTLRGVRPGANVGTPLRDLKDLLKDPRSLAVNRYLRRLYPDPVTGGDWVVIEDPQKGIIGVRSSSDETPARQANFPVVNEPTRPDIYKSFEGKTKYSEWQFVYGQLPPQGTIIDWRKRGPQ